MRGWAYFSAQAILQISTSARARSNKCASEYPIPAVTSDPLQPTDPDLYRIIYMLERNSGPSRSTLNFPRGTANTHGHLLWMSNLFVDLTGVGPEPDPEILLVLPQCSYQQSSSYNRQHSPHVVCAPGWACWGGNLLGC